MQTDVAIIGAGPAGMAAALQLKRSGIDFSLFEKNEPGGLLKNAWQVENYLGFPKITGLQLIRNFQQNLAQYDIKAIIEEVKQINYNKNFTIKTNKSIYYAKYLIVASGTKPKQDYKFNNVTVYYEIYPLLKEQHKTVVIIGAGDAAFDYALNLAKKNNVFLINRGSYIKALPLLINQVMHNQHITYKENYLLQQVIPSKNLSLIFNNKQDTFKVVADYLLVAIGRLPEKDFYTEDIIEKDLESGGVLYLAGDVKGQINRQVSIATASGINAAMQIYAKLRK